MIAKPAVLQCLVPTLSALLLSITPMSLSAQQNNSSNSAKERINFAGKLRMLSQRAAAVGCNVSAGVDEQKNRQDLSLISAEFWKILDGLKNGNSDLHINGEESDETVLAALASTKAQWVDFEELNMQQTSGVVSASDVELIETENLALLNSAQKLVETVLASNASSSDTSSGFAT